MMRRAASWPFFVMQLRPWRGLRVCSKTPFNPQNHFFCINTLWVVICLTIVHNATIWQLIVCTTMQAKKMQKEKYDRYHSAKCGRLYTKTYNP